MPPERTPLPGASSLAAPADLATKGISPPLSRRELALGGLASLLAGCGRGPARTEAKASSEGGWPRTVAGDRGDLVLPRPPRRIVSTSVTLTGTLLTIDAPVIASAATQANTSVSDAQGFFTQWGAVAGQRGVRPLYQGEPNAEAIVAAAPDLIVVSGTGGDSALRVLEQLRQVAPTLVLNYDDKSWQELAVMLGRASGRETQAQAAMDRFDRRVAEVAGRLTLPPQPTTAMVYYEDGSGANVWTPVSAQGKLLAALGFELARMPAHVRSGVSMGVRRDVVQLSGEQFADGVNGQTLLLFAADASTAAQLKTDRFLGHVPGVASGHVHAMGPDTFRLDYYSAGNLLDRIERLFT